MNPFYAILAFAVCCGIAHSQQIQTYSFPLAKDMQRADIAVVETVKNPKAVLVLCPGINGNGGDWIRQKAWQDFAKKYQLGLCGLSFASDPDLLIHQGRGYYYASEGSGEILLNGIKKIFSKSDIPLLLYGFSGGAYFISRFEEWVPSRITAWCAYSAGWWDVPKQQTTNPPGIIICGEEDWNYGASLSYFKQGRALGKPWLWISAPNIGHAIYPPVEHFVREYFGEILKDTTKNACWVDIDQKLKISKEIVQAQPSVTAWLPNAVLFDEWKNIHKP